VSIYTEALKRLHDVSKKLDSLERKYKKLQSLLESKKVGNSKKFIYKPKKDVKDLEEPTDDQTQLLREKLEAIRSMEKHLDESDNGN
jgi:peptidoglycan hydrolase CwlO-like protein